MRDGRTRNTAIDRMQILRCPKCGARMKAKGGTFRGRSSQLNGGMIGCYRMGRWRRRRRRDGTIYTSRGEDCLYEVSAESRDAAIREWNRQSRERWGDEA